MTELEKIRSAFCRDRFATEAAGIEIIKAEPRYALCEMQITDRHRNARGTPMGGAIFTLADFASAVAANGYLAEGNVISLHADITFLSVAKGTKLLGEANCVKHGRTATLYTVRITDELGTEVACVSMNGLVVPAVSAKK